MKVYSLRVKSNKLFGLKARIRKNFESRKDKNKQRKSASHLLVDILNKYAIEYQYKYVLNDSIHEIYQFY